MIKWLLIISILTLSACTNTRDLRPYPVIQSEQLMQQGIQAYQQDRYPQAIRFFNKAIVLYQSIDEQNGLLLARINVIKSALAINRFELAAQTLALTPQAPPEQHELATQLTLLKAHYLFLQQQYPTALQTIAPLLKQLPAGDQQLNAAQLNLILIQTKFSLFAHTPDTKDWFQRLSTEIAKNTQVTTMQMALFKRLAAHIAQQAGDQEQASALMQQALKLYKVSAKRRAIATCLEESAIIHIARQNLPAAKSALSRALVIRQWLKDSYKTQMITQQLQSLSIESNR